MRLLVDTHVLVWLLVEDSRVSRSAYEIVVDRSNRVFVSAVSAYEIEFKRSRDPMLMRTPSDLIGALDLLEYEWLPVAPEDAARAAKLPLIHRDPWDRMIVAQALNHDLTLVSHDAAIARYGLPVLW